MSIYSRRIAPALAAALLLCSGAAPTTAKDPASQTGAADPSASNPPAAGAPSPSAPAPSGEITPRASLPQLRVDPPYPPSYLEPETPAATPEPKAKASPAGGKNRKKNSPPATSFTPDAAPADMVAIFDGRPTEKLTLRQAIELALKNNLDAKYEHTGIAIQRAQIKFAAGAFDPVFVMSGQHQELREAQDTNNPSSVTEVNQQQQLQLQLNQAAQTLNAQVINAQNNALAIASAQQSVLANNLAGLNAQRAVLGEQPLSLTGLSALNPTLLNQVPLLTPNLNEIVILNQVNTQASTGFQGRTSIGTRYAISASLIDSRNTFTGNIAPVFTLDQTALLLQVQQPLLKNFGKDANLNDLRSAKLNTKVQTLTWKQAVSTSVQGVMAAYYDMLAALKDIQVRQEAITADSRLVDLYRRRVDLGFGSPFDISQAEVAVSTDHEALLVSKNNFLERQFALKRLIVSSFEVTDGRIFFPESTPNLTPPTTDRGQLLHTAFENRYDFRATLLNADLQDIRLKYAKNQLLPQLDLIGSYGLNGLTGGTTTPEDALFTGHQPQWSIGIQFQYPLGNRAARAQYDAFIAQKDQAIIRIKQSEIAVGVDVDTVISRIETSRQRVEAAQKTRELGEQAVRIAYRRLEEGQISAYDITEQQRKLYDARSRELGAQAELNKAVTLLWQVTGTVLTHENIIFDEPSQFYTPPPNIIDSAATEPIGKRR
jgi:outer membrane protein TolC